MALGAGSFKSWDESLHPRDRLGRFAKKWGMGKKLVSALDRLLNGFRFKSYGSQQQASQVAHGIANKAPTRFSDYSRLSQDWGPSNEALRAGTTDASTQKFVNMMNASMTELPDDEVLYRRVGPEVFGLTPEQMPLEDGGLEDMTGKLLADKGYTSTQIGAPHGQAPITMAIAAPKGTKVVAPGRGPGDPELILDKEQPIRITKVEPDGKGGFNIYAMATDAERQDGETPTPLQPGATPGQQVTPEAREAQVGQNVRRAPTPSEGGQITREEYQRRVAEAQAQAPAAPAATPGGAPAPRQEQLQSPGMGTGAPAAPAAPEAPEAGAPQAPGPVRIADFREAIADIPAPSAGPRRKEFNLALQGLTTGKKDPQDVMRDLESDIEVNKRKLAADPDGDAELERDIGAQEQLADAISNQYGMPRRTSGGAPAVPEAPAEGTTPAKRLPSSRGGTSAAGLTPEQQQSVVDRVRDLKAQDRFNPENDEHQRLQKLVDQIEGRPTKRTRAPAAKKAAAPAKAAPVKAAKKAAPAKAAPEAAPAKAAKKAGRITRTPEENRDFSDLSPQQQDEYRSLRQAGSSHQDALEGARANAPAKAVKKAAKKAVKKTARPSEISAAEWDEITPLPNEQRDEYARLREGGMQHEQALARVRGEAAPTAAPRKAVGDMTPEERTARLREILANPDVELLEGERPRQRGGLRPGGGGTRGPEGRLERERDATAAKAAKKATKKARPIPGSPEFEQDMQGDIDLANEWNQGGELDELDVGLLRTLAARVRSGRVSRRAAQKQLQESTRPNLRRIGESGVVERREGRAPEPLRGRVAEMPAATEEARRKAAIKKAATPVKQTATQRAAARKGEVMSEAVPTIQGQEGGLYRQIQGELAEGKIKTPEAARLLMSRAASYQDMHDALPDDPDMASEKRRLLKLADDYEKASLTLTKRAPRKKTAPGAAGGLEKMTKDDLVTEAASRGITVRKSWTKDKILETIQAGAPAAPGEAAPGPRDLDKMLKKELVDEATRLDVSIRPSWTKDKIKQAIRDSTDIREAVARRQETAPDVTPEVTPEAPAVSPRRVRAPSAAQVRRERQGRIDAQRGRAETVAEALELINNGASDDALRQRMGAEGQRGGLDDATRQRLMDSIEAGNLGEVVRQIAQENNLTIDGNPGDIVAWRRGQSGLRGLDGAGFRDGTMVEVVRPGVRYDPGDGEVLISEGVAQAATPDEVIAARKAGTLPSNTKGPDAPINKPITTDDRRDSFREVIQKNFKKNGTTESGSEIQNDVIDGTITPDEGLRRFESEISFDQDEINDIDATLRNNLDLSDDERTRLMDQRDRLGENITRNTRASRAMRQHFEKDAPTVTPQEARNVVQATVPGNFGDQLKNATPEEIREAARINGLSGNGDTAEEIFDNAIREIVTNEIERRGGVDAIKQKAAEAKAKKAAKAAATKITPKAVDKPKPAPVDSKYERIDANAVAEGLDLRENDTKMLQEVQDLLDGKSNMLGRNPTPARIGQWLDDAANKDALGPRSLRALQFGGRGVGDDPDRQRTADDLTRQADEWTKLADRLKKTRRKAKKAPDPTPPPPKVDKEEKKEIAAVAELTGIPAPQLEKRALAKKQAAAPPKPSATQVADTLRTVGSREEAETLLSGRTKRELLDVGKATGANVTTGDTKLSAVTKIVEQTVGGRLNLEAQVKGAGRDDVDADIPNVVEQLSVKPRVRARPGERIPDDLSFLELSDLVQFEKTFDIPRTSVNRQDRIEAIRERAQTDERVRDELIGMGFQERMRKELTEENEREGALIDEDAALERNIQAQAPAPRKRAPAKKAVAPAKDLDSIADQINQKMDADSVQPLLEGLTIDELRQVGAKIGVTTFRKNTKAQMRDDIAHTATLRGLGNVKAPRLSGRPTEEIRARENLTPSLQGPAVKRAFNREGDGQIGSRTRPNADVAIRRPNGGSDQGRLHLDSEIGQLWQDLYADDRPANSYINRIAEIGEELGTGKISLNQAIEQLGTLRDQAAGSAIGNRVQRAIGELQAPAADLPDLPEGTPNIVRRYVQDLADIPTARKPTRNGGQSPVDRVMDAIRKVAESNGQISLDEAMRGFRVPRTDVHESVDGATGGMWKLAAQFEPGAPGYKEVQAWIRSMRSQSA